MAFLPAKMPSRRNNDEQHRRNHSQDNGYIDHRPRKSAKPEDGSNGGEDEAQKSKSAWAKR